MTSPTSLPTIQCNFQMFIEREWLEGKQKNKLIGSLLSHNIFLISETGPFLMVLTLVLYNFLSPYPTLQMLHTKFGKNWPSSSWEEAVHGWQTMDNDGRQPIAIGHLSDSSDLIRQWKKVILNYNENVFNLHASFYMQ